MYRKFCKVCGAAFKARRRSAKYCSGKCSMLAYRSRRAQREKMERFKLTPAEELIVDRLCILYRISHDQLIRLLRRIPRIDWMNTLHDIEDFADKAWQFYAQERADDEENG